MNILFLTKELPYPPTNGHRIRTFNLLKGLAKKNKIVLICFANGRNDEQVLKQLRKYCVCVKLARQKQPSGGLKLIWQAFLGLFSPLPFAVKRRYSNFVRGQISRYLQNNNIDLIFCDSLYQAPYIPENTCNKVISEHNIESTIIYRYFKLEKNIFKKLYAYDEFVKMRRFEKKMWRRFDLCFVVSEKDKNTVNLNAGRRNIQVIPNGVDINYFCPWNNIATKPFSLIYTGQLDWHPNEDAVINFLTNIYPLIKKKLPKVNFWIVGNNPTEKIKRLAQGDASIIITGYVQDIRLYLAQANVVVVPLRIGSGTRLKILEAMAMGKPIVSTEIGSEGLDVTDGKDILIAHNHQDFAARVIDLLENPSLIENMRICARELVEQKYSWERVTERLNTSINQAGR